MLCIAKAANARSWAFIQSTRLKKLQNLSINTTIHSCLLIRLVVFSDQNYALMAVALVGALILTTYTDLGLNGIFAAIGAAMLVYGFIIALAVRFGGWSKARP